MDRRKDTAVEAILEQLIEHRPDDIAGMFARAFGLAMQLEREHFLNATIRKRGGRKLIIAPDGTTASPRPRPRVDSALLKPLAHGFRWQKMLKEGDYQTLETIADAENINASYVSRVLRLTLLAPEIGEAILAGRQPEGLTMARAIQPFPVDWPEQTFR
jgi:hypothetical protein